jgi:hypothetical protein
MPGTSTAFSHIMACGRVQRPDSSSALLFQQDHPACIVNNSTVTTLAEVAVAVTALAEVE